MTTTSYTVLTCDRCGWVEDERVTVTPGWNRWPLNVAYDLCPGCSTELGQWFLVPKAEVGKPETVPGS